MATEDARKLFMAGLPDSVTEETLRALFVETGARVEDLSLPKDRATGRPKGYAFVRLGSEQDTERARQELDGRIVDGKMISVRPFLPEPPGGRGAPRGEGGGGGGDRPGGYGGAAGAGGAGGERPGGYGGGGGERRGGGAQNAPDRTLYVGNLPYDASQEEVEAMFKEAGATDVVRVYLPVDQDGRKRGFGFVTMASAEAAQGAIEVLRDAALRNRRLMINIAHPPNKSGDRPPRPEGGFSRPMGGGPGGFSGGGGYSGGGGGGGGGGYSSGGPPGTGGPPGAGRRPDQKKKSFDDGGGPRRGQKGRRDEVWRDRDDDDE